MKSIIHINLRDFIIGLAVSQVVVLSLGIAIGVNIHARRIKAQVEEKGYVYVHRGALNIALSQTEQDMILVGMTLTWPWVPSRISLPNYFQLSVFDETGRQNIIAIGNAHAIKKPDVGE